MKKIRLTFILTVLFSFVFIIQNKSFVHANDEHSHIYDNGICECGEYEEPEYYQHYNTGCIVDNAGKLLWFVNKYNSGETSKNLYIKSDITLPSDYKWVPLGTIEHPFVHSVYPVKDDVVYKINLGNQEVNTSNYGFIGILGDDGDATSTIENIAVYGNFTISASVDSVGSIIGKAKNKTKVKNVSSYVNMTMLENGVGSTNIGGIVGSSIKELELNKTANFGNLSLNGAYEGVGGIVGSMSLGSVNSVINYGNIEANITKYLGGLIGLIDSTDFNGFSNSANLGEVKGKSFDISVENNKYTLNPGDLVGFLYTSNTNLFNNNYYINEHAYGAVINNILMTDAVKTNEEDISSGKLAYLLKEDFGQKLEDEEKEAYPILGSDLVYQVYKCDNKTVFYSNINQNEEHVINYSASENAIHATCSKCDYHGLIELVSLNPLYYDKTVKEVTIQTDIEDFDLSQIEIVYNAEPIFPGTYTASFTYQGLTVSLEFDILKGIPDKSMLIYHPLTDTLVYDGNKKEVNLYSSNEPGLGDISVSFTMNNKEADLCNAGTYGVKVEVLEGKYYQAHVFDILEVFTTVNIEPKEITLEWTKTTLFYEEGKNIYTPSYELKGLCYQDKPIMQFSQIGTGIGTFTTTIKSIDNNYKLVGDNLTTSFTVKKILVETPVIKPALYKNGVTQTADITDTEYYTVKENNGGSSANRYPVVLELKDPSKYTWETTDSPSLTVYFFIHYFESNWTTYPTISDWTYGEEPLKPTYEVDNSYLDITVMYRKIGGIYSKTLPTEVGEYEVIFISEKEDNRAYPLDDVVLTFNILKADPFCGIDSVFTIDYGKKLSDINLLGFGDGKWSFTSDENKIYSSGEYQIDLLFTPTNTKNYNTITKTVKLIVNKIPVLFEAPLKNNGLVYNNTFQPLVIPGNVIGGDLYYKVNDGEWSKDIPLKEQAGQYEVFYKVIGKENYLDIEEQSFIVEIKKVNLTIESKNYEIEQYTNLPTFGYTLTGLIENDELDINIIPKVSIVDTLTVGEYDINIEEVVSVNYNITYKKGTLKITEHTNCTGGNATCTKKAECELCHKEYGNLLDHVFNNYEYDNNATQTEDGTITSKCEHCEKTNTKVLENTKLPTANNSSTTNNSSNTNNSSTTNNSSNTVLQILIGLLIGIVLTSGGFILYFKVIKKKLNK